MNLREALKDIPEGLYIGANRYDSNTHHVLTIWADGERVYEMRIPKKDCEPVLGVAYLDSEGGYNQPCATHETGIISHRAPFCDLAYWE